MQDVTKGLVAVAAPAISRGSISALLPDAVVVTVPGRGTHACDALAGVETAFLAEGDAVLVWLPATAEERGVVLGRVGATRPDGDSARPGELLIEARQRLTLKCGDGSIVIREDGKILIKGRDLVSHATRMNRIKGGAVQIN